MGDRGQLRALTICTQCARGTTEIDAHVISVIRSSLFTRTHVHIMADYIPNNSPYRELSGDEEDELLTNFKVAVEAVREKKDNKLAFSSAILVEKALISFSRGY